MGRLSSNSRHDKRTEALEDRVDKFCGELFAETALAQVMTVMRVLFYGRRTGYQCVSCVVEEW